MTRLPYSLILTSAICAASIVEAAPFYEVPRKEVQPRPRSTTGKWRQDQATTQFYRAKAESYRLQAEKSLRDIAAVRSNRRVHSAVSRNLRLEQAKYRIRLRKLRREATLALGAGRLIDEIATGTVSWPKALTKGWQRELVDEAALILKENLTTGQAHLTRVTQIAEELRVAVRARKLGKDHAERLEAMETILQLELLANSENARMAADANSPDVARGQTVGDVPPLSTEVVESSFEGHSGR